MKIRSLVAGCAVLLAVQAGAQIQNEICSTAMVPVQGANGPCLCGGFLETGWFAQEVDMTLAIPDFPYPTSPSVCEGYTSAVPAPAADVWYLHPYWHGIYVRQCITCSDTCHVSFWAGTCGTLQPGNCFTVLPDTPTEIYPSTLVDTLFMQISSTQLSSAMTFDLCTHFIPGTIGPNFIVWNAPTPTTCLASTWTITDASSESASDGAVTIAIIAGNGPWTIHWADGASTFSRMDLPAGEYPYTIIDSIGCAQADTIMIGIDPATSVSGSDGRARPQELHLSLEQGLLVIASDLSVATVNIHDASGALVYSAGLMQGRSSIPLDHFRSGAYTVMCFTSRHDVQSARFVVHH